MNELHGEDWRWKGEGPFCVEILRRIHNEESST